MKFISIVLVTLFFNACGGAKNAALKTNEKEVEKTEMNNKIENRQNSDIVFEYIEQTRGFYRMVKITPEIVSAKYEYDGKLESKPCDKVLWKALMTEVESLNLKEIPTLEAPSAAHRYDAKPMANLSVIKEGNTYVTVPFDAGNPHEKLASLVSTMLSAIVKND